MDITQFYTENNEYLVEISKVKNIISFSEFSNYKCSIKFRDRLNNIVLQIDCSEKELYDVLQKLSDFTLSAGSCFSDIIHFSPNSNMDNYFWYIGDLNYSNPDIDNMYKTIEQMHPTDDDEDDRLFISVYQNTIQGNKLRLYLETTYSFIEVFVNHMYSILSDIEYFEEIRKINYYQNMYNLFNN